MRPITLISTLLIALHLLPGTAAADSGGGAWTWPVRGPVITPYLNGSDPYAAGQHRGADIAAASGTRVLAATAGTITFAGVVGSSGLTVAERTADGRLDLSYLHLGSTGVHRGDAVGAGDPLGTVGTSGRRSAEQPHLHFGVREAGSRTAYHDPLDFLPPPSPPQRTPGPSPLPVPVTTPATPRPTPASPAGAPPAHAPRAPVDVTHAPGHPAPAPVPHAQLPPLLTGSHGAVPAPAAGNPAGHGSPGHARPAAPAPLTGPPPREPHHSAQPAPSSHARDAAAHRHGINIGWLAACLGLIAAATALGHPDATRKLTARPRARIGSVLRPRPLATRPRQ